VSFSITVGADTCTQRDDPSGSEQQQTLPVTASQPYGTTKMRRELGSRAWDTLSAPGDSGEVLAALLDASRVTTAPISKLILAFPKSTKNSYEFADGQRSSNEDTDRACPRWSSLEALTLLFPRSFEADREGVWVLFDCFALAAPHLESLSLTRDQGYGLMVAGEKILRNIGKCFAKAVLKSITVDKMLCGDLQLPVDFFAVYRHSLEKLSLRALLCAEPKSWFPLLNWIRVNLRLRSLELTGLARFSCINGTVAFLTRLMKLEQGARLPSTDLIWSGPMEIERGLLQLTNEGQYVPAEMLRSMSEEVRDEEEDSVEQA
jgi:hypothetical protein